MVILTTEVLYWITPKTAKVTEYQAWSTTCHVSRNKELFIDQQYFRLLYRSVAVTRNRSIANSFTAG
jgi:hypothetical protein